LHLRRHDSEFETVLSGIYTQSAPLPIRPVARTTYTVLVETLNHALSIYYPNNQLAPRKYGGTWYPLLPAKLLAAAAIY